MATPAGLSAAQGVIDPQASDQLTQAMLARGSIAVDDPGQKMQGGIPQSQGGGIPLIGGGAGGSSVKQQQAMQTQVNQVNKGQEGVLMGSELRDAYDAEFEAMAQNNNANSQRWSMGSKAGIAESLFDVVRSPFTRKNLQEKRRERMTLEQDFRQRQLDAGVEKENQRRKKYIEQVEPLIAYSRPNMPPEVVRGLALQAAVQNMPIEKLIPAGTPMPTLQTVVNKDGSKSQIMINPRTGVQIEGTEPRLTELPPKEELRYVTEVDELGATHELTLDMNGKEVRRRQTKPPGSDSPGKEFSAVPGSDRSRIGLVTVAGQNLERSIKVLFDQDGNMANWTTHFDPLGEGGVALTDLDQSVYSMLRNETGAQIADSEVKKDVKLYVPQLGDSEIVAKGKIARLSRRIGVTHSALTAGLNNIPGQLAIGNLTYPGMARQQFSDALWDGTVYPTLEPGQTTDRQPEVVEARQDLQIGLNNGGDRAADLDARMAEWEASQR